MHLQVAGDRGADGSGGGGVVVWSSTIVSIGVALFLFQQLAGINAVVYYSTSVFRSAGIASDVAASALVGAANVFGTAVASSLMDRQGRKSLLITSFGGMAASMMLLSLSFTWKVLAPYSGPFAVLGTVLYVLSFSLGAGPVPALLLPEIFASRIRAKAVALSLGMHWNKDLSFAGFTKQMILEMCILSGCDYLQSLPGMGLKRAHALIKRSTTYDQVIKHLRYSISSVPPLYEESFKKALLTFQHQRVYDTITEKIVHLSDISGNIEDDRDFLGPYPF
ncbi:plastidic glucose transporter 4-like [Humulus lupulus]|uniref:plastidic glucose transporter 4-like n=1 Tax=Humulus lupulus TaxID=3486 RepID=UPI002B40D169|nr:plastidic glucose transporter 4-like [Humulus lupulus]